jgi:hypothetical protein
MSLIILLKKANLRKETLLILLYKQSMKKVYYINEIKFMS